jgi:hypothetical protein
MSLDIQLPMAGGVQLLIAQNISRVAVKRDDAQLRAVRMSMRIRLRAVNTEVCQRRFYRQGKPQLMAPGIVPATPTRLRQTVQTPTVLTARMEKFETR